MGLPPTCFCNSTQKFGVRTTAQAGSSRRPSSIPFTQSSCIPRRRIHLRIRPSVLERAVRRSEEEIYVDLNGPQLEDLGLLNLGWNSFFEDSFLELNDPTLVPARIVEEFRGIY